MTVREMLERIKGRSLTWEDVARKLGYSRNAVYRWVVGTTIPNRISMEAITTLYNANCFTRNMEE